MSMVRRALWVFKEVVKDFGLDFLGVLVSPGIQRTLAGKIGPQPTRWATVNALHHCQTIDGATLGGPRPADAWMKLALRKGLPGENERHLAVENDPHTVDGFDGEIDSGYGQGLKKLVLDDTAVLKIGGEKKLVRINYHRHDARRAGTHYDLVVEELPAGTDKFELNIPRGENAGRYAFIRTSQGVLVTRMKDKSVLLPKPVTNLKNRAFLEKCDEENAAFRASGSGDCWSVDRKYDGSLGNARIRGHQVILRSHRPEAKAYYDKLPALESIANRSPYFTFRRLVPGPDLDGTEFQCELVHPDGAARTGGLLNAGADRSRTLQAGRGEIEGYVWNLTKIRGRPVGQLPLRDRRRLWEEMVKEIRIFNPRWHAVETPARRESLAGFYDRVIRDRRGLPYSEGVVVKREEAALGQPWFKVKDTDTYDFIVVKLLPGEGKYAETLGNMVIANPETGAQGKCGSFQITDQERDWIWRNQDILAGQVAEFRAQDLTHRGVLRAPTFQRFHTSKSDASLLMYAEMLDQQEPRAMMYRLKSAAGWRSKS